MRRHQTKSLAFTAILVAFGILIPLVMPVKVVIGPASFTLASHVPVFMAMFISPQVAVLVALGTSLGLAELIVVLALTAGAHTGAAYIWSLVGLIGLGSLVHGTIDFYIAYFLWKFLRDKVGVDFSVDAK